MTTLPAIYRIPKPLTILGVLIKRSSNPSFCCRFSPVLTTSLLQEHIHNPMKSLCSFRTSFDHRVTIYSSAIGPFDSQMNCFNSSGFTVVPESYKIVLFFLGDSITKFLRFEFSWIFIAVSLVSSCKIIYFPCLLLRFLLVFLLFRN